MEHWKTFRKTKFSTWEVSNFGNIRKNGKHYEPYERGGHDGNRYLALSINEPLGGYVHRIVASYFIPNPEGKSTVNHKDGNKKNNHIDNLEWEDYSRQRTHAFDNGLNSQYCVTWDRVTPYDDYLQARRDKVVELRRTGKTYGFIAEQLGISITLVRADLVSRGEL